MQNLCTLLPVSAAAEAAQCGSRRGSTLEPAPVCRSGSTELRQGNV